MSNSNIIIEVVIRSIAIVLSLGALIAATISLDKLLDINNSDFSAVSTGIIDTLSPDVRQVTTASVALAIASGVVIPMEIVMIVLRFFKIKLGIFGRIIVIVDFLLICFSIIGYGLSGILAAVAAKNWSDDVLNRVPSSLPFADVVTSDIVAIRNDIAATAACTFLACGACVILLFFVVALMVKSKKMDYTGK